MEIRTKRWAPPPLTSTSTISMPSDCATRCAISSIFDATADCIVPFWLEPTKKWAFAHWVDPTFQSHCSTGSGDRFIVVARRGEDVHATPVCGLALRRGREGKLGVLGED